MSQHDGHRKRLRERYMQTGFEGFQEHEILELLLTFCIPRRDTNPLAHRLIDRFGSLYGVMTAAAQELQQVEGMGDNSAVFVSMMLPMLREIEKSDIGTRPAMDTYGKLKKYCKGLFIGEAREKLYLLCLDSQLHLITSVLVSSGTVNGIAATPRQIAAEAMKHNAAGVVLTHNHPSGNNTPSAQDIQFTAEVQNALSALSIPLHEHIVVGTEAVCIMEAQRGKT